MLATRIDILIVDQYSTNNLYARDSLHKGRDPVATDSDICYEEKKSPVVYFAPSHRTEHFFLHHLSIPHDICVHTKAEDLEP